MFRREERLVDATGSDSVVGRGAVGDARGRAPLLAPQARIAYFYFVVAMLDRNRIRKEPSMAFDLAVWRAETQQIISDFAHDPRAALARAGTNTLYGMLLGSTLLPLVAAYASDPKAALATLFGVVGGLGGNLVANLVQQKYDGANALAVATREAQETELAPVYQKLAQELQVIPLAEQALTNAGQTAMLEQLRAELRRLNTPSRTHNQTISGNAQVGVAIAGDVHGGITHTQQSGGVNFGSGNTIERTGDVVAGDKVAGDKVMGDKIMNYGAPKPADTGPEHIRHLIDQHTRRLRVLESQAAATGYNVRPEVQNEIEDIRAELARLQELLDR